MLRNDTPNIGLPNEQDKVDSWFTAFIDHLKTDHLLLTSKVAPEETIRFYNALITGDEMFLAAQARKISTVQFIKKLVYDYLSEFNKYGRNPLKLALGLSESKILVWSEIEDNDEETEDALLLAEAKVNGKYRPYGFYVNSTIIEKSDKVPVPPHYQTFIN